MGLANNGDFSQHTITGLGDYEDYIVDSSKYKLSDFQRGMRILKTFHNTAISMGNGYNLTFDQLLDHLVRNNSKLGPKKYWDLLVAGLGEAVTTYGKSESWALDVAENLAIGGEGQIPESYFSFLAAMNEENLNNPNWIDAAKYVTVNTVKDVVSATATVAQSVGTGLVTTLKMSKYLIPAVAVGSVVVLLMVLHKKADNATKIIDKLAGTP